MADQSSRGGKKQQTERQPAGKQHQGVRPGSTARKKERGQQAPRRRVVLKDRNEAPRGENVRGTGPPSWILVADASRARVFSGRGGQPQSLVSEFDHPESRLTGKELSAIEPGREQSPAAGHILSIEKRPLPEMEEERFARELARVLADGRTKGEYEQLVLVAAPEFLGRLCKLLDSQVAKCVARTMAKDYTRADLRELQERLA